MIAEIELEIFRKFDELEDHINYGFLSFHNSEFEGIEHHSQISISSLERLKDLCIEAIQIKIKYMLVNKEKTNES